MNTWPPQASSGSVSGALSGTLPNVSLSNTGINQVLVASAWKKIVRVASETNINLATPGASIDGVALTANDRVLLFGQTNNTENGIYVWTSAVAALTRADDLNVSSKALLAAVPVLEGTFAHQFFISKAVTSFILDTSDLAFTPITGPHNNIILYLNEASGNDSGTGKSTSPLKTVDECLRRLAQGWRGTAFIYVVDSFTLSKPSANETILNFYIPGPQTTTGQPLIIEGVGTTTLQTITITGGTKGNTTSVSPPVFGTVTTSTLMTAGNHVGAFISFSGGATNGLKAEIGDNDTGSLYLIGTLGVAPTTGTGTIYRPTAVWKATSTVTLITIRLLAGTGTILGLRNLNLGGTELASRTVQVEIHQSVICAVSGCFIPYNGGINADFNFRINGGILNIGGISWDAIWDTSIVPGDRTTTSALGLVVQTTGAPSFTNSTRWNVQSTGNGGSATIQNSLSSCIAGSATLGTNIIYTNCLYLGITATTNFTINNATLSILSSIFKRPRSHTNPTGFTVSATMFTCERGTLLLTRNFHDYESGVAHILATLRESSRGEFSFVTSTATGIGNGTAAVTLLYHSQLSVGSGNTITTTTAGGELLIGGNAAATLWTSAAAAAVTDLAATTPQLCMANPA